MRLYFAAMRKIVVAALVALSLVAPAYAEIILSPSGQPLNKATCKSDPGGCLNEAGRACGGPYQVIDSESHAGGMLADWLPGPVTWYSMLYQCGASDGRMPSFDFRGPQWRTPSMTSCSVMGQSVYCWGN